MKRAALIDVIVTLIVCMYLYASSSKYFDFPAFQRAMHNQPFPSWFSTSLTWFIPPVEIAVTILLLFGKSRKTGFLASTVLMGLFTIYVAAILLHLFPRVPCSCGGIIRLLTWNQHLLFNVFFLIISFIGWRLTLKPRLENPGKNITDLKDHQNISRAKSG
jgi:uncharacterized membrane protein YphA (DoxX/SURF4 family)